MLLAFSGHDAPETKPEILLCLRIPWPFQHGSFVQPLPESQVLGVTGRKSLEENQDDDVVLLVHEPLVSQVERGLEVAAPYKASGQNEYGTLAKLNALRKVLNEGTTWNPVTIFQAKMEP